MRGATDYELHVSATTWVKAPLEQLWTQGRCQSSARVSMQLCTIGRLAGMLSQAQEVRTDMVHAHHAQPCISILET